MHIELTDLLRCPNQHAEAFLVLLPEKMDGRLVIAGHLGCPVCGWNTDFADGVPTLGEVAPASGVPPFNAEAALALIGVSGSGGWVGLAGRAGTLAAGMAKLLDDVKIVAVNPPEDVHPDPRVSIVRSPRWPVNAHALRGVIIGEGSGVDQAEAVASVLPGLRAVGEGGAPELGDGDEMMAIADGIWVMKRGG